MTAETRQTETAAEAGEVRWGLHSSVDEIVDSVLDAADQEILEDLGEERGTPRGEEPELLRELMHDVVGRYLARCRRRTAAPRPGERA